MRASLLLLAVCLVDAPLTRAQDADPPEVTSAQPDASKEEPEGYRALVAEALDEYEAGHFEEARALFQQAHTLFPNARTLRGLGMVAFELRNYGESIAHLEAALTSEVRPLDALLRADAEQLLSRARRFVARISLRVSPERSRVFVDGVEIQVEGPLLLNVGEHVVEIRATSFVPERRVLKVTGGEQEALRIELVPVSQDDTGEPLPEPRQRVWFGPQIAGIRPVKGYADHALGIGFELSIFVERRDWVLDFRPGIRFDLRPGPDDYLHVPVELAGYYRLPTESHAWLLGAGTGLNYVYEEVDVTRSTGDVIMLRTHTTIEESLVGIPLFVRAGIHLFRRSSASLLLTADYAVTFGDFKEERTNEQAVRVNVGALFGRNR